MGSVTYSSSSEYSDEDNHPPRLHRWEAPVKPQKRRRRRRTVDSYPDEEVHFVHNPGPDHQRPARQPLPQGHREVLGQGAAGGGEGAEEGGAAGGGEGATRHEEEEEGGG